MWRSQCIEEDDRYIMYIQASVISAHVFTINLFSSPAGPVERSLSITAPDIWITVNLSHQISHYIQITRTAANYIAYTLSCLLEGREDDILFGMHVRELCAHNAHHKQWRISIIAKLISLRHIVACDSI